MQIVPDKLIEYTEMLSRSIRLKNTCYFSKDAERYRQFIRSNIESVISHTFPLFSHYIGHTKRWELVDAFLKFYQAEEPEFHQIATEFVCFVQGFNGISNQLVGVLEYEWVLFNTEISPHSVPKNNVLVMDSLFDHGSTTITLNPTVQCLEVCFGIYHDMINFCPLTPGRFFLAVFRDSDHQVISLPLSAIDRFIIDIILNIDSPTFESLKKNIDLELDKSFDLISWLISSSNINLVHIKP